MFFSQTAVFFRFFYTFVQEWLMKVEFIMRMPKVSIIVPVHNTEQYLGKCLASIFAQTLKDIEIILVENASTDNSLELCHRYAQEDSRIRVIHLDKGDLSTARNEGVKIAHGDYVGFVDSDDTIEPTMYDDMHRLAVKHGLGMVTCLFRSVYDKKPARCNFSQDGRVRIVSAEELTTLNFLGEIPRSACVNLYRRDLFEQLQFPEDMYHEDRASTFLFMAKCGKGGVIHKSYYNYYQRGGSIIHTKSFAHYRDFALACSKSLEYIHHSTTYTKEQKAVYAKYIADTFLRKLWHVIALGKNKHKDEVLQLCKKIAWIPKGTKLSSKAKLIRSYVEKVFLRLRRESIYR